MAAAVVCWYMFNNPFSGESPGLQHLPICVVSILPPQPISSYQGDIAQSRAGRDAHRRHSGTGENWLRTVLATSGNLNESCRLGSSRNSKYPAFKLGLWHMY